MVRYVILLIAEKLKLEWRFKFILIEKILMDSSYQANAIFEIFNLKYYRVQLTIVFSLTATSKFGS